MSRKHRSLVDAFNRVNAERFEETAASISRITQVEDRGSDSGRVALYQDNGRAVTHSDQSFLEESGYRRVNQTDNQTVHQTDAQSVKQSATPYDRPSSGLPVNQTDNQTVHQTDSQSDPLISKHGYKWAHRPIKDPGNRLCCLTESQLAILHQLMKIPSRRTTYNTLAELTGLSFHSVRSSIKAMVMKRILNTEVIKTWEFQGFTFSIPSEVLESHTRVNHTLNHTVDQTDSQTDPKSDRQSDRLYIDDDFQYAKNHHLSDELLPMLYPNLVREGLRSATLIPIFQVWQAKSLDPQDLRDYLEMIEYEVETRREKFKTSVIGYLIESLKKGSYSRPAGFKLLRERQAEERLRRAKEMERVVEEAFKSHFDHWWMVELDLEGRKKVDAQLSKKYPALVYANDRSRETARQEYFREYFYDQNRSED